MEFKKQVAELQTMIDNFFKIHNNPYDTSKHDAMASKLEELQELLFQLDDCLPNNDINKLQKWSAEIISKYKALQITKMKSLDSAAISNINNLQLLLTDIDNWYNLYLNQDAISKKYLKAIANKLGSLQEEGYFVAKVVDENQLNSKSQVEFAKVIEINDKSKQSLINDIDTILAISASLRTQSQIDKLAELESRLTVIKNFEKDLLTLIDNNKVRIDRVTNIKDVNGNNSTANGQAIYDNASNELVLQLDATAKSSLGAHELLHLVQAKKGKLVFMSTGHTMGVFNDLLDEVEAYQIQFSLDPASVPNKPQKITDITPTFVQAIDATLYGKLPSNQHDLNTKIIDLNKHPMFFGDLQKNVFNGNVIDPKTGIKVSDWDYYKD